MHCSGGRNVLNTALTILVAWLPVGWAQIHQDGTLSGCGDDCGFLWSPGFFVVVGAIIMIAPLAIYGIIAVISDCIKKCRHQQPDTSQPEHPTRNSLRTELGSPGRDSVELVEPDKEVARRF